MYISDINFVHYVHSVPFILVIFYRLRLFDLRAAGFLAADFGGIFRV